MASSNYLHKEIQSTQDKELRQKITAQAEQTSKPFGALGFLGKLLLQMALVQGKENPELKRPVMLSFAADHGFSLDHSLVGNRDTAEVLLNNLENESALVKMLQSQGAIYRMVDMGVEYSFEQNLSYWLNHGNLVLNRKIAHGSRDFLEFPAMTTAQGIKGMETGQKLVESEHQQRSNIIAFGSLGRSNVYSSLVLTASMLDKKVEDCVDGEEFSSNEIELLDKALKKHPKTHDPVTLISLYGGHDTAAMAGAILSAAHHRMLVVIDGFMAAVAAALAIRVNQNVREYLVFPDSGGLKAHRQILLHLEAQPLLNFHIGIEGYGTAMILPLLRNALGILKY